MINNLFAIILVLGFAIYAFLHNYPIIKIAGITIAGIAILITTMWLIGTISEKRKKQK